MVVKLPFCIYVFQFLEYSDTSHPWYCLSLLMSSRYIIAICPQNGWSRENTYLANLGHHGKIIKEVLLSELLLQARIRTQCCLEVFNKFIQHICTSKCPSWRTKNRHISTTNTSTSMVESSSQDIKSLVLLTCLENGQRILLSEKSQQEKEERSHQDMQQMPIKAAGIFWVSQACGQES